MDDPPQPVQRSTTGGWLTFFHPSLGSPSTTRVRYARKQLENPKILYNPRRKLEVAMLANSSKARKHYMVRVENVNSLCSQTARKPENTIESPSKPRTRYACKQLGTRKLYRIPIENANPLCSQTARLPENLIESPSKTRIRCARRQVDRQKTL